MLLGAPPVYARAPDRNPPASAKAAGHGHGKRGDSARAALKFSHVLTADCMLHRSKLMRIANTDPKRAVRVVLVSYTGKTRSQGASDKVLPPKSGPVALGCDGIEGLERRWQVKSARFVDPNKASAPQR